MTVRNPPSFDDPGVGAPESDIEITPEMVEAGTAALGTFDFRFGHPSEAVERIFKAMLSARTGARNL
jgi:hypothetical protein